MIRKGSVSLYVGAIAYYSATAAIDYTANERNAQLGLQWLPNWT